MNVDETSVLKPFTEDHKNTHHEGGIHGQGEAEEEDEGENGGQRVKC
jgi:hypothetical protein